MRKIYPIAFALSVGLVVGAVILIAVYGLNFGIDFRGGSVLDVTYDSGRPAVTDVVPAIASALPDVSEVQVTPRGEQGLLVRSEFLSEDEHRMLLGVLSELSGDELTEESFETIGPAIGAELKDKSIKAIIYLIIAVVVYIAFVFRGMSRVLSPWAMGLAAILALAHDLIVPIGIFAYLGYVSDIQITAVFVAAVLTILGYSLSDTVVVFDRVRENLIRGASSSFSDVVHMSVKQTLVRSLNTTATTLAALVAIYLFGGESLHHFALALIIGIALGSYSSLFVASPLLVWFSRSRYKT